MLTANAQAIHLQAKLFAAFPTPQCLSILNALGNGALTVGEIVQATGLTQSNVSNHLGCLRLRAAAAQQTGRFVYYALSDQRVGQLLRLAHELLADVAKGVYDCTRYDAMRSHHGKIANALKFPVKGMDCAECTQHVQHALAKLPGVESVNVLLTSEKAIVQLDPDKVDMSAIRRRQRRQLPVPDTAPVSSPAHGALHRRLEKKPASVFILVLAIVVVGEWLGYSS